MLKIFTFFIFLTVSCEREVDEFNVDYGARFREFKELIDIFEEVISQQNLKAKKNIVYPLATSTQLQSFKDNIEQNYSKIIELLKLQEKLVHLLDRLQNEKPGKEIITKFYAHIASGVGVQFDLQKSILIGIVSGLHFGDQPAFHFFQKEAIKLVKSKMDQKLSTLEFLLTLRFFYGELPSVGGVKLTLKQEKFLIELYENATKSAQKLKKQTSINPIALDLANATKYRFQFQQEFSKLFLDKN